MPEANAHRNRNRTLHPAVQGLESAPKPSKGYKIHQSATAKAGGPTLERSTSPRLAYPPNHNPCPRLGLEQSTFGIRVRTFFAWLRPVVLLANC